MLSPAILGEMQSRNNRSSFLSTLAVSANLNNNLNSRSILDNIVDKTSNAATYYKPRSYLYNEDSSEGLEGSEANERLDGSLRDSSYLRQEQPNFYRSYDFLANKDNVDATPKPSDNIDSSIDSIQDSATNLYSSYHGGGFPKAAFPHGPFLDKPYGGFHSFGPYGPYHHPYGGTSEESSSEESARVENNGTNRAYGSPYFGNPYSPFPYGGYGNRDFYGPYQRNGTDSSENGRNTPYGYGLYNGGSDFYGPPGYGYGYNRNDGNGNSNNNQRQTEEPADNGDQSNSTKNGYSPPYGPPWVKPLLGTFPHHGFLSPFNPLPYDHFHGVFKGGPVVGVGPVGYPIYADPYLVGFPLHHPYGPFFPGKKYLPPKNKPADSGESTQAPAELTENENPERIIAPKEEVIAPAPSSNRYKTSGRKEKRINLVNFEKRRV